MSRELFVRAASYLTGLFLRTHGRAVLNFGAVRTCDVFAVNTRAGGDTISVCQQQHAS